MSSMYKVEVASRASLGILALIFLYLLVSCIVGSRLICRVASFVGSEYFFIVVGLLLYNLAGRSGLRVIVVLLLVASVTGLLKVLIESPRPPVEEWLVSASGPGFPSGHTSITTSFWAILYLETGSRLVLATGVFHIAGVAVSRVVLRVHYPIDVVGGIIVGTALPLFYKLLQKRSGRSSTRLEQYAVIASIFSTLSSLAIQTDYYSLWMLLGLATGILLGLLILPRYTPSVYMWRLRYGVVGFSASSTFIAILLLAENPYYWLVASVLLGYLGICIAPLLERLGTRHKPVVS